MRIFLFSFVYRKFFNGVNVYSEVLLLCFIDNICVFVVEYFDVNRNMLI